MFHDNSRAMHERLRQYRATPHSNSDFSPCEALDHRKLITLPELTPPTRQRCTPERQKNMTDRDAEQKMKAYADQKLGVRERKMKLVVEGKKLIHDYGK